MLAMLALTSRGWAQGFQSIVLTNDVSNAISVATADFDGDGDMDAVATGKQGTVAWIEMRETGGVTHAILNTGVEMRGVAAGDFTGDGLPDIIVASYAQDRFILLENTGVSGDNRFREQTLAIGHGAYSVRAGDVNHDGALDVVTTDFLGNTVRIFEQQNGALVPLMGRSVPSPMDAVFADFDGDGDMDVIVCSNTQSLLWIEHGQSDTSWTVHNLGFGTNCTSVAVADLDSSGTQDLAGAPFTSLQFDWWQQVAADSFVEHALSGTVTYPRSVAIADLDQDGRPDIVASAQDGTMRWWHNGGRGTFATRTMQAGSSLYGLAVSDFDQDGDPDVLVADYSASSVLLYRNTMGIPAVVSGTVRSAENGAPISGVHLRLVESGASGVTDAAGAFTIAGVPGTYTLRADCVCWTDTLMHSVSIARGETTRVALAMAQPEIELGLTSLNLVVHNRTLTVAQLPLTNTGNGPLTVTATAFGSYANGTWLSVTPASAEVAPGDSFAFAVRIYPDTSNSGGWDYYGRVELHDNACPDSLLNVGVIVYVLDSPEHGNRVPLQTELHPAYPNPFNAVTTLTFDLAVQGNVEVRLFDITGRAVRTITSGTMVAGRHRMPLDAEDLPSGVYLLALHAGGERFTQKLLLIK